MSILTTIAANQVLNNYCITEPNEIPIEDLVYGEGAIIQEANITGALGRIVFGKNTAIITVSKNISNPGQKRFVIAHELGHFKLHKNLRRIYNCNETAFLEWNKRGSHETEANQFASELLMPRTIFQEKCKGKKFSMQLVKDLAGEFNTSITSTAIKYSQHGVYPIAVIFSRKNIVKWSSISEGFPLQFIGNETHVPSGTVAYDYFASGRIPIQPELVDAMDWFASDFNVKQYQSWKFYEQCLVFKTLNAVMSFLWCK